MLPRRAHLAQVLALFDEFPVVALLGARQVGKSTLARSVPGPAIWYDLENPRDIARLQEPLSSLEAHRGLVVIDEVHRRPDLFPILRVLADRPGHPARFLVLGSASPDLLRQGSETLAGRIGFHVLPGFDLDEVGTASWRDLWLRGRLPRSFLARSEEGSWRWRNAFVDTFLSRDLASVTGSVAPYTMRRFWTMLAHVHGQVWNAEEFGRAFGMSGHTVRRYLDLLAGTYVATVLPPFHENLGKRQVKAPKVYVADSGLLHALLGVRGVADLEGHPKVGASWEGFALGLVARELRAEPHECFFWGTHNGAELDLLVLRGSRRLGFEFKRTDSPVRTRSMMIAKEDLGLDGVDVIYPGRGVFSLGEGVWAIGIEDLSERLGTPARRSMARKPSRA